MADLPNFENLSKEELIKLLNAANNELNVANKKIIIVEQKNAQLEKRDQKRERSFQKLELKFQKRERKFQEKERLFQEHEHQFMVMTVLTRNHIKLMAEMTKKAHYRMVIADKVVSLELSEQLKEIFTEHIEWIQDAVKWRAQLFASGPDVKTNSKEQSPKDDSKDNPKDSSQDNSEKKDSPEKNSADSSKTQEAKEKYSEPKEKQKSFQEQLEEAQKAAKRGLDEAVKRTNKINKCASLAIHALPNECLTDELKACITIAEIKTPKTKDNAPNKSPGKKAKHRKSNRTIQANSSNSHVCAICGTKMQNSGDKHCKQLVSKVGDITRCIEVLEMINDMEVCPQCGRVHVCLNEKEDLPIKPNRSIGLKFVLHACDCICHGVPLNQLAIAVQQNLEFGHSTIVDNLSDFTQIYLLPIYNRIIKRAEQADYIMADGTPFDCLETQGRGNCIHKKDRDEDVDEETSTSNYILSFCSVPQAKVKFSCYDFLPTRSFNSIKEVLTDDFKFKTLICDAFPGYDTLAAQHHAQIQNCLVHLRRYIVEDLNPDQLADELLAMSDEGAEKFITQSLLSNNNDRFLLLWVFYAFSKIYAYEGYAKELNNQTAIINAREIESKLMTQIETIMNKMVERHLIPTKSGKKFQKKKGDPYSRATFYWYSHKEHFKTYLSDPMVPPDSNMVEQSIRPLTILRKNSYFMNSERGIKDLCIIFTIWRTFRLNGIDDPFAHLMKYCRDLYSHCIDEGYTRAFKDNPDVLSKKINTWNMQELSKDFNFDRYLPF